MLKKLLFLSLFCSVSLVGIANKDSTEVSKTKFNHHVSGSFTGILNFKVRVQYERQLGNRASFGANLNYYFVNWTGPTIEPFVRIYGDQSGSNKGFFGQAKLIYGNLSVLDYDLYSDVLKNNRWSTFGAGVAVGYKFLIIDHLTIEPLMGFRVVSPPTYNFNDESMEASALGIGEGIGWYLTTGLPLDFQLKFGWQF